MNWLNVFVYLGMFIIGVLFWAFIVYYVLDWFK